MTYTQGDVMFILHHHQPMTAHDINRAIGAESNEAENILQRLYSRDLLVRRKREQANVKGREPFEYAIKPIEDWE